MTVELANAKVTSVARPTLGYVTCQISFDERRFIEWDLALGF